MKFATKENINEFVKYLSKKYYPLHTEGDRIADNTLGKIVFKDELSPKHHVILYYSDLGCGLYFTKIEKELDFTKKWRKFLYKKNKKEYGKFLKYYKQKVYENLVNNASVQY